MKWWLLALPHYLVIGLFAGGWGARMWGPGLIGVLVLVAGVLLLFGRRYRRDIFDFVMGMNRWALRVAAYSALMRDECPPFRLDMGPAEPEASANPVTAEPAIEGGPS